MGGKRGTFCCFPTKHKRKTKTAGKDVPLFAGENENLKKRAPEIDEHVTVQTALVSEVPSNGNLEKQAPLTEEENNLPSEHPVASRKSRSLSSSSDSSSSSSRKSVVEVGTAASNQVTEDADKDKSIDYNASSLTKSETLDHDSPLKTPKEDVESKEILNHKRPDDIESVSQKKSAHTPQTNETPATTADIHETSKADKVFDIKARTTSSSSSSTSSIEMIDDEGNLSSSSSQKPANNETPHQEVTKSITHISDVVDGSILNAMVEKNSTKDYVPVEPSTSSQTESSRDFLEADEGENSPEFKPKINEGERIHKQETSVTVTTSHEVTIVSSHIQVNSPNASDGHIENNVDSKAALEKRVHDTCDIVIEVSETNSETADKASGQNFVDATKTPKEDEKISKLNDTNGDRNTCQEQNSPRINSAPTDVEIGEDGKERSEGIEGQKDRATSRSCSSSDSSSSDSESDEVVPPPEKLEAHANINKTEQISAATCKKRENITFKSGWRKVVKLIDLLSARLITEKTVKSLESGILNETQVAEELHQYLQGEEPIAGLLIMESGEKMSLHDATKKRILRRGTAVSLLEAQAATGSIINPYTGEKMNVEEATSSGLIDKFLSSVLVRAERAAFGFQTKISPSPLSLFEAMKRNLVVESHGIRLLEAQIATGGIIDPRANHRLPVEVAYERGIFDERLNKILEDSSDDTKGFFDPNTNENLTYLQLIERCVLDEETSLKLLPIYKGKQKKDYWKKSD